MDEVRYYINKEYLKKENFELIKKTFDSNRPNSIQLREILSKKLYNSILPQLKKIKWELKEEKTDYFRYSIGELPEDLLKLLRADFFKEFISSLTGIKFNGLKLRFFRFSSGDYTLLHDKLKPKEGVVLILDLTRDWDVKWGGQNIFLNEDNELLRINPLSNSLTLIKRDNQVKDFVKYVNHFAKTDRIFVYGIFY